MKYSFLKYATAILAIIILVSGCKKEKGESNEEELITTVALTFTPAGGGPSQVFEYVDSDGPGGLPPTIDGITLSPATSYDVSISFRNDIAGEDITEEIEEETESHRIYYLPSPGNNITIDDLDNDVDGNPLGLHSVWTTTSAFEGHVVIVLRHYAGNPPNKAAGDPVDSPKSSTDAEVVFPVSVQ
ncbi:MAG: hypothetical protein NVV59_02485 [Chitinophagaceae bacterium]|nr:hypothetical protein [Chitinophagaceae bacterium]